MQPPALYRESAAYAAGDDVDQCDRKGEGFSPITEVDDREGA